MKEEHLMIRIEKELKESFYEKCKEQAINPSEWVRLQIKNFVKEESKMKLFKIDLPGLSIKTIEADNYQEAIEVFEETLWDYDLLAEDENLNAADLGYGGGRILKGILEEQGFLNYGQGEKLPCISEVTESETEVCAYCDALVTAKEVPDEDDDEAWQLLAWDHRSGCEWVETRAHTRL